MSCSSTSASPAGITTLGFGVGDLAVRYLLVGLVVILIRGIFTEVITARMTATQGPGERGGDGMTTTTTEAAPPAAR